MAFGLSSGAIVGVQSLIPSGFAPALYNPKDVVVTLGAIPISKGIARGTFVTARRNKTTWSMITGCDGEDVRVRTNDYSGTISLTLRQGSPINDHLSAQLLADEISGVLAAPMVIDHVSGRSLAAGSFVSIEGPPPLVFSTREEDVTWNFICSKWQPFNGGFNPLLSTAPDVV